MGRYDSKRESMEVHTLSRRCCCTIQQVITVSPGFSAGYFNISCTNQEG